MKKEFVINISIIFLFVITLISCNNKSKIDKAVEEMPLQMKVERFDEAFFKATPETLPKLKLQYPFFFPVGVDDKVWLDKIQDKQWKELAAEVDKKYKNFEPEKLEIENLFKHIKFYFPTIITPKIYTIIGEMDMNSKAIYANDKLIISLELYLGKEHRFYQEFPAYIKQNFEIRQILPDITTSFAEGVVVQPNDKTLLSQMIYYGKQLYLKDVLLPDYTDAERIGYTTEQISWSQSNESYIWEYFIEKQLLYNVDSHLSNQFINLAPFSKFYLEIDNESPGRIGQWIGWQIVRSFMQNNSDVSVQQLVKLNAKQIFEKSKYKPKKNEQ